MERVSLRVAHFPPNLRLALATGFMGAHGPALLNVGLTQVAGLLGLWVRVALRNLLIAGTRGRAHTVRRGPK